MSLPILRRNFILGAAAVAGCTHAPRFARQPAPTDWLRAEAPDPIAARALFSLLARLDTTSLMAVHRGRVIASYGDESLTSYLASARKSLVSMTFGPSVARGVIDVDVTLETIGFDDIGGLLPIERTATIRHLLMARSGVYHRAANLGDASDLAPPRGSVRPGEYFLYNNWDFNALGAIFEKVTGRGLYRAFEEDIARPIGMQDWRSEAQPVRNDTRESSHPAQHFVLSTRDMARIGVLMLQGGRWGRRQVLPWAWVQLTTKLATPAVEVARTSPFIPGLGYGYLWWIFDSAAGWDPSLKGGYTASGAFGQFITVLPALDLVVAHKTQAPSKLNVTPQQYFDQILPAATRLVRRGVRVSSRA
jgi:CubicO group peptidase (beta-lactamase class C family)